MKEAAARREEAERHEEEEELARAIEFERRERAKLAEQAVPDEPPAGGADVAEVVLRA